MSHFSIFDLNFIEPFVAGNYQIQGGRMGRITPTVSTDVATAIDTRATTRSRVSGNLTDGFQTSTYSRGSAAAASAAAVSIGGTATATAYADAG